MRSARCALPICKMPQVLVIAALGSWLLLIAYKMLTSRLLHQYDISRSHMRNAQYNCIILAATRSHVVGGLAVRRAFDQARSLLSGRISDSVQSRLWRGFRKSDSAAPCLCKHSV
jgi:hypothetical protein